MAVLLTQSAAAAQVVFSDDFGGDELLPHWDQPRPEDWEYALNGGLLSVTALHYPSDPKLPGNIASLSAVFQSQADFRIDVWMGWDGGDAPHRLDLELHGPNGVGIFGGFGYSNEPASGPVPVIHASVGNAAPMNAPAPPSGLHRFTVTRVGRNFEFYLDDELFARQTASFDMMVGGVALSFVGPFPGTLGALHVDRVLVVPAPVGACVAAAPVCYLCSRRRTRSRRVPAVPSFFGAPFSL